MTLPALLSHTPARMFRMGAMLTLVAFLGTAQAQTITLDPGPVGTSSFDTLAPFNTFNGTPVTGQHLLIDFVYPNHELLRDYLGTFIFVVRFTVAPTFVYNGVNNIAGTGGFLAGNGGIITGASTYGSAVGVTGGFVTQLGLVLSTTASIAGTNFDSYGAHFDITFPNLNGAIITNASVELESRNRPFVVLATLPENGGTFWLLALGLAALFTARRRSRSVV